MGYEVQKWDRRKYVAYAWFQRKEDAEAELARLMESGNWWGLTPRIVAVED